MPDPPATEAHLEVPLADDRLALPAWPSLRVHWAVRHGTSRAAGDFLIDAARSAELPATARAATTAGDDLSDIDVDRTILWETQALPPDGGFYAWVAGEAGAVNAIRRILLQDRGLPRTATNLMGYWRQGKALD